MSEQTWTRAFRRHSESDFAAAFAGDVTLEASALVRPITGRDVVAMVLREASTMYAELEFVDRAETIGSRWLAWRARTHSGLHLDGVTVLEHGPDGLITRAAIHHRPLHALLAFSSELAQRLTDRVSAEHFWASTA